MTDEQATHLLVRLLEHTTQQRTVYQMRYFLITPRMRNRFLAKVAFCPHGNRCKRCCWPWMSCRDKYKGQAGHGHGRFMTKTVDGKPVSALAHVVMYCIKHGPIADDSKICHSCDVPYCVNFNHLWEGSQNDNIQDMLTKGRARLYGNAQLKPTDIPVIFALKQQGLMNKDIAERLGMSRPTISLILNKKRWHHEETWRDWIRTENTQEAP